MNDDIDQIADAIHEDPDLTDVSLMRTRKHLKESGFDTAGYEIEDTDEAPLATKARRAMAGGDALLKTGRAGRAELKRTLERIRTSKWREEQEMERLRQMQARQAEGRRAMVFPIFYMPLERGGKIIKGKWTEMDTLERVHPSHIAKIRKIVLANQPSAKEHVAYTDVYTIDLTSKKLKDYKSYIKTIKMVNDQIDRWRSANRSPIEGPHINIGNARWGLKSEFVDDLATVFGKGSYFRKLLVKRYKRLMELTAAKKARAAEGDVEELSI